MPARLIAVSLSLCLALSSSAFALGGMTGTQVVGPTGGTVVAPVSVSGSRSDAQTVTPVGQDFDPSLPASAIYVGAGLEGRSDSGSQRAASVEAAVQDGAAVSVERPRLVPGSGLVQDQPTFSPAAAPMTTQSGGSGVVVSPARTGDQPGSFDEGDFTKAAKDYLPPDVRNQLIEVGRRTQGATPADVARIYQENIGTGSPSEPAGGAKNLESSPVLAAAQAPVRSELASAPGFERVESADVPSAEVQRPPTLLGLVPNGWPMAFQIVAGAGALVEFPIEAGVVSVELGQAALASTGIVDSLSSVNGGGYVPAPGRQGGGARFPTGNYLTGGSPAQAARLLHSVSAGAAPAGRGVQHGVRGPSYRGLSLSRPTTRISVLSNRIPVPLPNPVGRPWPMPNNPSRPTRPVGRP